MKGEVEGSVLQAGRRRAGGPVRRIEGGVHLGSES
jgi:hypothetical protein